MSTPTAGSPSLARQFAIAVGSTRADMTSPAALRHATHLFVNWAGCVLGGFNEPSVSIAHEVLFESAGAPVATVIGRNRKVDVLSAALMNSLSASGYAFNEAHLQTSIHPVGPAASAIYALGERRTVDGAMAMLALLLGCEVACRLDCCMMAQRPAIRSALSPTGLFGSIAVMVAAAKILQLNEDQIISAIGLAALHGPFCRHPRRLSASETCGEARSTGAGAPGSPLPGMPVIGKAQRPRTTSACRDRPCRRSSTDSRRAD